MKIECNCPKCRADRGDAPMTEKEAAEKIAPIFENLGTVAETLLKTLREINPDASPQHVGHSFAHGYMTILLNLAAGSMKPGAPPLAKYEYFKALVLAGMNSNIQMDKEMSATEEVTNMPEGVRAVFEALGIDPSNVVVIRPDKR